MTTNNVLNTNNYQYIKKDDHHMMQVDEHQVSSLKIFSALPID